MVRPIVVFALLGTVSSAGNAQHSNRGALIAQIDSLAHEALESGPVAAMSVAVEQGDELVLAKGYGYADIEHQIPATAETVFRLGSITKQFTATAILQLVELGKIGLDDPITKFFPDYPIQGHHVTIHHLLTHTSGIKSYTGLGPKFWNEASRLDLTHQQLVDMFASEPFDFAPGEKWSYNNSAYYLLGMIIEKVSGQSYDEYLDEHFFEPLGMMSSSYCDQRAIVPHRARGYSPDDGKLVNATYLSMNAPGAAGALCSSGLDLLRWQDALDDGVLMSPDSHHQMLTQAKLNDGSNTNYAYGLFMGELNEHRSVSHGGGINGFSTMLATYPDDSLVVVVLANTETERAGGLANSIARVMLGVPHPTAQDLPLPEEQAARYVGTYELGVGNVRVFEEAGVLQAELIGSGTLWKLQYQGDDEFAVDGNIETRLRFIVPDDRANELIVSMGANELRGKRSN